MSVKPKGNPPTHGIYITPQEGKKGRWQKIGAAWLHKDKLGSTLIFDALPVGGRAVIRLLEDETNTTAESGDAFNEAADGGQQ